MNTGQTIRERVISNFSWTAVSVLLGKFAFLIATIYLARTLGTAHYGIFTYAMTIVFYFWWVVDLGTGMYGTREIAKNREQAGEIVNPLLSFRLTVGFLVFALYVTIVTFSDLAASARAIYIGCGVYLVTYALYTDWVFRGVEKFKYIVFGNFLNSMTFLLLCLAFVHGEGDLLAAGLAWSLSFLTGGAVLLVIMHRVVGIRLSPVFDLGVWKKHLKESIFISTSGVMLLLYRTMPIILVGRFFSDHHLGVFTAPYALIIQLGGLGFMLPTALYPIFSDLYMNDRRRFKLLHLRFQAVMLTIGAVVAAVGYLFAKEIVLMLFGEQYQESIEVMRVLILLVPLYYVRYTYGGILLAAGFQKHHNIASFLGVTSVVGLIFLLVDTYGFTGVLYAIVIAESVIVVSMMVLSQVTFRR